MRRLIALAALYSGAAVAQPAATSQFLLRIEPTREGFTLQNMTAEEGRLAAQHVQYLKSLLDSGRLSLAAQAFDPKGLWGMIIVNAPDLEAARALLDGDPMLKARMFRGEAMPVRVVFQKVPDVPPPAAVDVGTLESYSGTYKSDQIPLEIKVFVTDGKLHMQGSGQPEFALRPTSATRFEFSQAGVVVEFQSSSAFTLKQGGSTYRFKKAVAQ